MIHHVASWAELRKHAAESHELSTDAGDLFAFEVSNETGRRQRVFVRRFNADERAFVELRTIVCKRDQMPMEEALTHNAELPFGGLAVEDGMYFLVHRSSLEHLSLVEYDLYVAALAQRADELEAWYSGRDVF